jgi:hypothetical protein
MSRVLKNSSLMKTAGSLGEPASHLYADFIYSCLHDDCKYGFSSHESVVHAGPEVEYAMHARGSHRSHQLHEGGIPGQTYSVPSR